MKSFRSSAGFRRLISGGAPRRAFVFLDVPRFVVADAFDPFLVAMQPPVMPSQISVLDS
ncbi:MAG: hypothetical protein ACHREM_10415 [Polyangiales bacterium]